MADPKKKKNQTITRVEGKPMFMSRIPDQKPLENRIPMSSMPNYSVSDAFRVGEKFADEYFQSPIYKEKMGENRNLSATIPVIGEIPVRNASMYADASTAPNWPEYEFNKTSGAAFGYNPNKPGKSFYELYPWDYGTNQIIRALGKGSPWFTGNMISLGAHEGTHKNQAIRQDLTMIPGWEQRLSDIPPLFEGKEKPFEYFTSPDEIQSRMMQIRQAGRDYGYYDPMTQDIDEESLTKILDDPEVGPHMTEKIFEIMYGMNKQLPGSGADINPDDMLAFKKTTKDLDWSSWREGLDRFRRNYVDPNKKDIVRMLREISQGNNDIQFKGLI